MKMKPCEILQCLGFDVPPEGIEINPDESHLYIEALSAVRVTLDISAIPDSTMEKIYNESIRLIGEAIDVSTIPDALLQDLHSGFSKLILAARNKGSCTRHRLDTDVAEFLFTLVDSNFNNKKELRRYVNMKNYIA